MLFRRKNKLPGKWRRRSLAMLGWRFWEKTDQKGQYYWYSFKPVGPKATAAIERVMAELGYEEVDPLDV